MRGDAAERIGGEGDARIGGAEQRQAGLDGAQQRVVGMLGRADGAVEPLVVGDIEDELGLGRVGAEIARKDRLVADQRDEGGRAGRANQAAAIARSPAIGAGDELAECRRASRIARRAGYSPNGTRCDLS